MEQLDITTYFETDHSQLDGLFREYQRLKQSNQKRAEATFERFRRELKRHILWEEEILFPIFESKTGMTDRGPTVVMRMEHQRILASLESIRRRLREVNPGTDNDEQLLLDTLARHNLKEERILYPAIDRSLSDDELTNIFKAMNNLPPDRYTT